MWTRVFTRDDGTESMVAIHKIGTDLSYDKAVRESLNDFDGQGGEVLFSPLLIKSKDLVKDLKKSLLPEEELLRLAKVASSVKKRFCSV